MKTKETLIATTKDTPKEAVLISHQYMIKASLIKKMSSGIYTWMPLGLKTIHKVQKIVRDEMNKIGASELLLPSILPLKLLEKSNRLNKFGSELLKLHDRYSKDFYYGPTHEEPIVDLVKNCVKSYKQLPLNLYQIQTKFRDEIRPRFGTIRAREFIMKDAYSFHDNIDCLNNTYNLMYKTYSNILNKLGLIYYAIEADTDNIGGNHSHEFQILTDIGEDIICYNDNSNYAINIELATYEKPILNNRKISEKEIVKIHIPNVKCVKQIAELNNLDIKKIIKTIIIKDSNKKLFALAIRSDHELNKYKINKLKQISPPYQLLNEENIFSLFNLNLNSFGIYKCPINIIADYSAVAIIDFVCGANEYDYYLKNVNWNRDIPDYEIADIRNVVPGDIFPDNKGIIKLRNGIEVGHIFKLNDIYSKSMTATITDKNGQLKNILVGCYGFGISRIIAAIIEQSHDKNGIIWPEIIAPYDVAILPINYNKSNKVKEFSNNLYKNLINDNIDVILDNRGFRAGVMFADADLIGYSHHIIIDNDLIDQGLIKYKHRKQMSKKTITITELFNIIKLKK